MVTLMADKKGSGKTKRIVEMANSSVGVIGGNVVFINNDKRPMYDLHHDLRFINMEEFPIESNDEFFGFICGLISSNYDIQRIYIDGLRRCAKMNEEQIVNWFNKIENISSTFSVDFIITMSYEDELAKGLEKYLD